MSGSYLDVFYLDEVGDIIIAGITCLEVGGTALD
jgi:hypothetical protein